MSKPLHCPTPDCNQILFKAADFVGQLEIKCSKCKEMIEVKIELKPKVEIKCIKTLAVLLIPLYLYVGYQVFSNPVERLAKEMENLLKQYVFQETNISQ